MSNNKSGGLVSRYKIEKTNGEPVDPAAKYFVLRYDKDPHAIKALLAYADSVQEENPELASDIRENLKAMKDRDFEKLSEGSLAPVKETWVLEKAKAVRDESGHWYVVPAVMADVFDAESADEDLVDSGGFDAKWGDYRTGGDLNLVQLWAEF